MSQTPLSSSSLDLFSVIDKFLETEDEYVKSLATLQRLQTRLVAHCQVQDPIISETDITDIFSTACAIYTLTQEMNAKLNKSLRLGVVAFLLQLGALLVNNVEFFTTYAHHLGSVDTFLARFANLIESQDSKFKQWVEFNEIVEQVQYRSEGLSGLLKLPQRHLPSYSGFLRAVTEILAADADAKANPTTQSIIDTFGQFAEMLNTIHFDPERGIRQNRIVDIQTAHRGIIAGTESSSVWTNMMDGINGQEVKLNKVVPKSDSEKELIQPAFTLSNFRPMLEDYPDEVGDAHWD